MPSKNRKQFNFFLLVKAYKENGDIGVKRHWKFLEGYKPRLTPAYMEKLIKTANSITDADLIDKTSGVEGNDPLGDVRELKPGYWALFRGKYKVPGQTDEIPKEGEFIAQIKNVNQQKGVVNFNHNGFRNKYGQTMIIPKRANASSLEFMYLDYALFDNVIKTGRSPEEISEEKVSMEESIRKIVNNIFKEEENLIPDNIIDTFYRRIERAMKETGFNIRIDTPSITKELDRIKSLTGGKIPDKIQALLDSAENPLDLNTMKKQFDSLDENAQWQWIVENKSIIKEVRIDEDMAYAILNDDEHFNNKHMLKFKSGGGYNPALGLLKALGLNANGF